MSLQSHLDVLFNKSEIIREDGVKKLSSIYSNILKNPFDSKYQHFSFNNISKKFAKCPVCIELMFDAGFKKSKTGKKIIFNINNMHLLKKANKAFNKKFNVKHNLSAKQNKNDADIEFKFDQSDTENMKKLDQLIAEMNHNKNDPKLCDVNSIYLLNGCDVYSHHNNTKCQLKHCQSLHRMCNILKRYRLYIEEKRVVQNKSDFAEIIDFSIQQLVNEGFSSEEAKIALGLSVKNMGMENIYDSDNYSNTHLLNDFNHLLSVHSAPREFEDIYNILIVRSNNKKECEMRDCLLMRRNQRNRSIKNEKLYFDADIKTIVKQQLIDRIHEYFFHSFDSALKLTQKEKENIINENDEKKINDDDENIFDPNVYKIYGLIKSKKNAFKNILGLNRLNGSNHKFNINVEVNQKQSENEYSFGRRYFYWEYYRNKYDEEIDPAQPVYGTDWAAGATISNKDYKLGDWYVDQKYHDFKHELLSNAICTISFSSFNELVETARDHIKTGKVRKMKCARTDSAKYYELEYNQPMSINHLLAMMVHCNLDELQHKFAETFRYKNKNESDNEMKQRHQNYYHLGRSLREMVECYGMNGFDWTSQNINLYHGVNDDFTFSSLNAWIAGPLSTTISYSVAVNFSQSKGMILNINMYQMDWVMRYNESTEAWQRLSCIDCKFISDYVGEQEIFCIGGLNKFTFNTIIKAPTGHDYCAYIKGLKQMTYCMSNGDFAHDQNDDIASTSDEQQMVFRLLSHELNRYYPNHQYSHEFKNCPDYFKNILHSHCKNITLIHFLNRGNKESKFHEILLKYDNEWIKLDVATTILPNLKHITYNA
eukprot:139063_1